MVKTTGPIRVSGYIGMVVCRALVALFLLGGGVSSIARAQEARPAPATTASSGEAGEAQTAPAPRRLSDEALYKKLSALARKKGDGGALFRKLAAAARGIDWKGVKSKGFKGNLRLLEVRSEQGADTYLVRAVDGSVYVLWLPPDPKARAKDARGPYADLKGKLGNKMAFEVQVTSRVVDGVEYRFVKLTKAPERLLLDRLFFIAIVLLLFLTMVGMGLTLTLKDFAQVFKKPAGMILGPVCQFGLMPVIAYGIGRAFGYYETYPFIFLGLILIASSPGGVTSNLMTYLGKGDVALSVSLTAVCTVLSLFMIPLLLTLWVANIPAFEIPVMVVFKQILVLVIVPLFVGMLVRSKWERLARKLEKPFAMIGVFALLFLIVVGVWSNFDKFADTSRYGVKFYAVVFLLTLAGMVVSAALAKLLRISNFQIRAIALECGLRNASLAMTIAILLQDRIGDFYSSMFFTAGIFGLWMYAAGAFTIWSFKYWLPVGAEEAEELLEKPA
jgi:BASS family bile acid:Na+ symporter